MTRAEFEKRKSQSDAFLKLIALPEWQVIDDMFVQIDTDTRNLRLLDIPPDKLGMVADMAKGRIECIAIIRDYMAQWISDANLKPSEIDVETLPDVPSVNNS